MFVFVLDSKVAITDIPELQQKTGRALKLDNPGVYNEWPITWLLTLVVNCLGMY